MYKYRNNTWLPSVFDNKTVNFVDNPYDKLVLNFLFVRNSISKSF